VGLDGAKELEAARQHAKGLEEGMQGLAKKAADAEAALAAAAAAEMVAVAGVNGGEEGGGAAQVMYLEKVLSLEQRLAHQVPYYAPILPSLYQKSECGYSTTDHRMAAV
jgi:hypothetical protein